MSIYEVFSYLIIQSLVIFGPFILNLYLLSKKINKWSLDRTILYIITFFPFNRKIRERRFKYFNIDFNEIDYFEEHQTMHFIEMIYGFIIFQISWSAFEFIKNH